MFHLKSLQTQPCTKVLEHRPCKCIECKIVHVCVFSVCQVVQQGATVKTVLKCVCVLREDSATRWLGGVTARQGEPDIPASKVWFVTPSAFSFCFCRFFTTDWLKLIYSPHVCLTPVKLQHGTPQRALLFPNLHKFSHLHLLLHPPELQHVPDSRCLLWLTRSLCFLSVWKAIRERAFQTIRLIIVCTYHSFQHSNGTGLSRSQGFSARCCPS